MVLGSSPQREWLGRRHPTRKEYGDWFTTWPTTFPTVKNVITSEDARPAADDFCGVYKPLLDALSTLPRLKMLSFANRVSRSQPGFNQTKQASLDSFPKRHLGKPSANNKRWSDGYAMFAILAALGPQIQQFAFPHLFTDVYKDLISAERDFALRLHERPGALKETEDRRIDKELLRARLGGYIVSNGSRLVSDGKYAVCNYSCIAEMRRHRVSDVSLDLRYLWHNGEEEQVKLVGSYLYVG